MTESLSTKAARYALEAHRGQKDKAGKAYISHPMRVAARVRAAGGSDEAVAVAWLHDVIEDTGRRPYDLIRAGFPLTVVASVILLTRRADVTPENYYAAIRLDPVALMVKLADVADNSDESRLCYLEPETANRLRIKYAKARASLTYPGPLA